MTSCYLLSGTCTRLFAHTIHVGAYLRGFRTPVTSMTLSYYQTFKVLKRQEIFILGCFNVFIFKGFSLCIFFLYYQLNTNLKNLTQMLCHKIVHITFQRKHNYVLSMILQISVQSGTRAASIV